MILQHKLNIQLHLKKSSKPQFFDLTRIEWSIQYQYKNSEIMKPYDFIKRSKEYNLWEKAECTINNVREYHPNSRVIWRFDESIIINSYKLIDFFNKAKLIKVGDIDFLKYDKDCFASKHIDRMGDYTCLIFPSNNEFKGGELILHSYYNKKIIFNSCNINFDIMVIFPTKLEHEVLPVVLGERYVFKFGLINDTQKYYEKKLNFNCKMD